MLLTEACVLALLPVVTREKPSKQPHVQLVFQITMGAANVASSTLPVRVGLDTADITLFFWILETNVAEGLTPRQQQYTRSYICFKYCRLLQKESIPSHLPSDVCFQSSGCPPW